MKSQESETSEERLQWQEFENAWRLQAHVDRLGSPGDAQLDAYVRSLQRDRRKELGRLLLDLAIGGMIISLAISGAIDYYDFLPSLAIEHPYVDWLTGKSFPGTSMGSWALYVVTYGGLFVLGLLVIIDSIVIRWSARRQLLHQTTRVHNQVLIHFDSRIKLSKLTQKVGLGLFMWIVMIDLVLFVEGRFNIGGGGDYLMLTRFALFVLFPGAIFAMGKYFELKARKSKARFVALYK